MVDKRSFKLLELLGAEVYQIVDGGPAKIKSYDSFLYDRAIKAGYKPKDFKKKKMQADWVITRRQVFGVRELCDEIINERDLSDEEKKEYKNIFQDLDERNKDSDTTYEDFALEYINNDLKGYFSFPFSQNNFKFEDPNINITYSVFPDGKEENGTVPNSETELKEVSPSAYENIKFMYNNFKNYAFLKIKNPLHYEFSEEPMLLSEMEGSPYYLDPKDFYK
tara:strand:+ start:99 stop:764 length:666 start_codon:yes stop_codon:yes gene_type:complete